MPKSFHCIGRAAPWKIPALSNVWLVTKNDVTTFQLLHTSNRALSHHRKGGAAAANENDYGLIKVSQKLQLSNGLIFL